MPRSRCATGRGSSSRAGRTKANHLRSLRRLGRLPGKPRTNRGPNPNCSVPNWTAAGIAIKIVRAVMTAFSQSIVAVCRSVAFDGDPQAVRSIAAGPLADGDVVCHALPRLSAQPAPGGHQPFACCCSSLLIVFLDSALRLHAAHRAYVANIHEMGCDRRAFLGSIARLQPGHRTTGSSLRWRTIVGLPPGCSRDPPQQTRSRSLRLNAMRREFLI